MATNKTPDLIRASRKKILEITNDLSLDTLNRIPADMNNNIIWNLAHLIAVQQNHCYINTGLTPLVEVSFIERFKPGTRPEGFIGEAEYETIKEHLLTDIDQLEKDYSDNRFVNSRQFVSKTYPGLVIDRFDDILTFVAFHEGLHLGYIMAMKHQLL